MSCKTRLFWQAVAVNLFSVTLEQALHSNQIERSEFSRATEIGLPTLSKYFTGKAFPKPPALAKIMSELPPESAAEVFSSYLKEVFGTETIKKVESSLSRERESFLRDDEVVYGNDPNADERNQDEELDYHLLLLKKLAKQRPEIAEMLKALVRSLR